MDVRVPESISVVSMTSSHTTLAVRGFDVSDVTFSPDRFLARHSHPRACVAVVVDGVVEKSFGRRSTTAPLGTIVTMPADAPHADAFGRTGARIVVAESRAGEGVDELAWSRDWNATLIAVRIARELSQPDSFTPLAVEGLVLELLATAHRTARRGRSPQWLRAVCDLLDDRLRVAPDLDDLSETVGVDTTRLALAFRMHLGESIGEYARRRRLEWAALQLVGSDVPLTQLALEAGFADQSHFTRAFKRFAGMPPGRYRDAARGR